MNQASKIIQEVVPPTKPKNLVYLKELEFMKNKLQKKIED